MPFQTKVKGKVLSEQSCELVENIIKYFISEKKHGGPMIPIEKLQERVAVATGVSPRTIRNIVAESKTIESGVCSSFKSPGKKRAKGAPKTVLEGLDRELLIKLIQNFHKIEKNTPTVTNILRRFREDTGYSGAYDSFRRAIRKLGFRWRKTATSRKWVLDKPSSNEESESNSNCDSDIESCTSDSDEGIMSESEPNNLIC